MWGELESRGWLAECKLALLVGASLHPPHPALTAGHFGLMRAGVVLFHLSRAPPAKGIFA